jgi:hypothetical protein
MNDNKMAPTGRNDETREAMEKEALSQGLLMIPDY